MRSFLVALLILSSIKSFCQLSDEEIKFFSRLKPGSALPEKILDTRTAVFYSFSMTQKDLDNIQLSFQRTGIDATVYFDIDELLAGKDVTDAYADYLTKRDITNIIFFLKDEKGYKAYITAFNGKASVVEENQYAWIGEDGYLSELLTKIYRAAGGGTKRKNMLINETPETDISINVIQGRRSDFFAIDMKVDELAIPKTGNEAMDKALEEAFSTWPFKHKFTEPGVSERELRNKGSLYILCYVHTRCAVAKKVLGYDVGRSESAIASVTFNDNGQTQLKNIPSETFVYKFYFKHIDSGNVFLGTKWDADVSWDQALKNQVRGFKSEFKIQ